MGIRLRFLETGITAGRMAARAARPLAMIAGAGGLLWSAAQVHVAAAVALLSAALLAAATRRRV